MAPVPILYFFVDTFAKGRSSHDQAKTWKLFVAGCMLLLGVQGATAKNLSPDQLKSECEKGGGVYMAPGVGGAYGCLTKGGDLVACDGSVPKDQPYCGVYRAVSGKPIGRWQGRRILRTRGAARL